MGSSLRARNGVFYYNARKILVQGAPDVYKFVYRTRKAVGTPHIESPVLIKNWAQFAHRFPTSKLADRNGVSRSALAKSAGITLPAAFLVYHGSRAAIRTEIADDHGNHFRFNGLKLLLGFTQIVRQATRHAIRK